MTQFNKIWVWQPIFLSESPEHWWYASLGTRGPVLMGSASHVSCIVCAGPNTLLIIKSPVRSDRNYQKSRPQFHKSGAGLTSVGSRCWLCLPLSHPGWPPVNRPRLSRFLTGYDVILCWSLSHSVVFSAVLATNVTDDNILSSLRVSSLLCPLSPCHCRCLRSRVCAKTEPGPVTSTGLSRPWHQGPPGLCCTLGPHIHNTHHTSGGGQMNEKCNTTQSHSRLSCIRYFSSVVIVFVFAPRHLLCSSLC